MKEHFFNECSIIISSIFFQAVDTHYISFDADTFLVCPEGEWDVYR